MIAWRSKILQELAPARERNMRRLLILAVTCSHTLALLMHGSQPVQVTRPHLSTPHVSMAVLDRRSLLDSVVIMVGGNNVGTKKEEKFVTAMTPVTKEDVLECQKKWAGAIVAASKIYREGGDYIQAASGAVNDLYGYGFTKVLFKPTRAAEHPFRPTSANALSYFVGGGVVEGGYDEDAGFAINGGRGWKKVEFFNHDIDLNGLTANAMGYYIFTDATTKDKVRGEYTFVYKRCTDGKVGICVHHSSVPYAAAGAGAGGSSASGSGRS